MCHPLRPAAIAVPKTDPTITAKFAGVLRFGVHPTGVVAFGEVILRHLVHAPGSVR